MTTGSKSSVTQVAPQQAGGVDPLKLDLIDVRTPAEYGAVHAAGARLSPLDRLDAQAELAGRRGPADDPIFLICKSGKRAAAAAEKFAAAGCAKVCVIEGGTDGWIAAGLPVVRGKGVISLERQVRIAAGSIVLLGVTLAVFVHPWLIGLSAFVGAGLVFAGITDWCGMGMLLAKMPWNQRTGHSGVCPTDSSPRQAGFLGKFSGGA